MMCFVREGERYKCDAHHHGAEVPGAVFEKLPAMGKPKDEE